MKVFVRTIWCLLLIPVCIGYGQTKTADSLRNLIPHLKDEKQKLQAIFDLHEQSIDADTLLPYLLLGEEIAGKTNDHKFVDQMKMVRASYYARKNRIDSGLVIINELINDYKSKKKGRDLYLKFLFFRAKISDRGNHYSQALTQLYEVIETASDLKDTLVLIQAKTGIGWVLIEMEQYKEALKWLYDAKQTSSNEIFYKNYGALYSNIAAAYNGLGNRDSALQYISIAIKDAKENENLLFLATALSMQAKIFVDNGMLRQAEAPLHEVLTIRRKLNDPFYAVFDMANLATYYAKNEQPEKGIELCKEGIAIAKKLRLPSQLLMIYKALSENYKAAGDQDSYGKTLEYIIALKDSFNNINSAKMLADMQAANEKRKTEKVINEQKLNLTAKNYLLFGSALFALLIGVIIWLSFKNYKRKQKLNMELAIEKEKILSAQAVKDAEDQERKRIAADLHDNLGAQANAILYSAELLQQEKEQKEILVNDLHHTAKDMLTALRETLWVLKKTDLTAADVWIRVINFCKQIHRHYAGVKIITDGIAPAGLRLNSVKALNTVFIIQEAINNALRHSEAQNITVSAEYSADCWKIFIADDGKGFDAALVSGKPESYGLSNMQERAVAAALDLKIDSKLNEGTSIQVLMNTKTLIQKEY